MRPVSVATTAFLASLSGLGSSWPVPSATGDSHEVSLQSVTTDALQDMTAVASVDGSKDTTASQVAAEGEPHLAQVQITMPDAKEYQVFVDVEQDEELVNMLLSLGIPLETLTERSPAEGNTVQVASTDETIKQMNALTQRVDALIVQSNSMSQNLGYVANRFALAPSTQWIQYVFTSIAGIAGIITISVAIIEGCDAGNRRRRQSRAAQNPGHELGNMNRTT
jgi:type III secretion system FlhB-like substrate exporter